MEDRIKTLAVEEIDDVSNVLQGQLLDIILALMDNELTEEQLISKLDMYPMKLQYYLIKLKKLGIVECIEENIIKENVRIKYRIIPESVNLTTNLSLKSKNELEAYNNYNHFGSILKKSLKFANVNPELTNKQGAIFIHTNEEKIKEFKIELNKLIDQFMNIEVKEENNGYVFMPILLPYEIREEADE